MRKLLFLLPNFTRNVLECLIAVEFRISVLILFDDDDRAAREKTLAPLIRGNFELLGMLRGAANEAPQYIASVGITWPHAIPQDHRSRSHVIGDDAERCFVPAVLVFFARMMFKVADHLAEHIDREDVRDTHRGYGDALESSAEIYVGLRQECERSIFFFYVLHKNGIGDFKKEAAIAVGVTFVAEFWVMRRPEIVKYFGVRAARLTDRHIVGSARATPPIFLGVIIKNSPSPHAEAIAVLVASDFSHLGFDSFLREEFFPNIC